MGSFASSQGSSGCLLAGGPVRQPQPSLERGRVSRRPHTPGARPQIRGSFLLGSYPRPFHNWGKSAGLRVAGYCSLHPHSSLLQAPWGDEPGPSCRFRGKKVARNQTEAGKHLLILRVGWRGPVTMPSHLSPSLTTCKHLHSTDPFKA